MPRTSEDNFLMCGEPGQPDAVHANALCPAPARPRDRLLFLHGRRGRRATRGRHHRRRPQRCPRRRIAFAIVVEFDDLDVGEVPGCLPGELDHQDGPYRKVGRHDRTDPLRATQGREAVQVLLADARGADDRPDACRNGRPGMFRRGRAGGELDEDIRLRVEDVGQLGGQRDAKRSRARHRTGVLPYPALAAQRCGQRHIRRRGDRSHSGSSHAAGGAGDRNPNFVGHQAFAST